MLAVVLLALGGWIADASYQPIPHYQVREVVKVRRILPRRHFYEAKFVRVEFASGYLTKVVSVCQGYGLQQISVADNYVIFAVNGCAYDSLVRISRYQYITYIYPHR